jgi:SAM-dependent methyltransferase
VPSPLLRARIDDFETALLAPGANERLQFARQVVERRGMNPATEAGRTTLRQYLEQRTSVVGSAVHSAALLDPSTALVDQLTLFKDRGLASDTAILIDYAIDRALDDIRKEGLLEPGTVRRVAIVGPGLDFADKQEGYDFYPQQTIQPFALIDSLIRLGLASRTGLQVTAFDLSPRVLQHFETARERAASGASYSLVLPRKLDQSWAPEVVRYWERFGDQIGAVAKVAPPPSSAGPVTARSVLVRPSVTLSLHPRDVNIVVQRIEPAAADEQFDLVLATNILLYYDVFEQSLAVANVARMLRPGGLFLTNDRVFELPAGPVRAVGQTDVIYMKQAEGAQKGDRITWYQR